MATYRIKLANGKTLAIRGDEPPTDAEIEQVAQQAGVQSLLMSSKAGESGSSPTTIATTAAAPTGSAAVAGAAARPVVQRIAMEAATNPRVAKIPGVVGYGATAAAVASDLRRGEYGRAAGDAV